jgi:Predicted esterase of the alpha-beta hydrolase superfamily
VHKQADSNGAVRLAFALGGGAALGWAHVGVLRVTEELGLRPDLVVGTSMGAIVGAAYCAGLLADVEEVARNFGLFDMLGQMWDLGLARAGWLSGRKATRLLARYFGDRTFADLAVPFHALATDLVTGEAVLLSEGSVVSAIRASMSLPMVYEPVVMDGRVLIDGGMKAPVPMQAARELGASHLLAVHVAGDHPGRVAAARLNLERPRDNRGTTIATLAFALQSDSLVEAHRALARPDVYLEPEVGAQPMHAFHKAEPLIAIGEAHARRHRAELVRLREVVSAARARRAAGAVEPVPR